MATEPAKGPNPWIVLIGVFVVVRLLSWAFSDKSPDPNDGRLAAGSQPEASGSTMTEAERDALIKKQIDIYGNASYSNFVVNSYSGR